MEAVAVGTNGDYVAEGYFEDPDSGYVPGTINVYYTTKTEVDDYTSDISKEDLPDEWKNSDVNVIDKTDDHYLANITLADGEEYSYEINQNISLSTLQYELLGIEPIQTFSRRTLLASASADEDWTAVLSFFKDLKKKYEKNVISNVEDIATDEERDLSAAIFDDTKNTITYVFWDSAKDALRSASIKFLGSYWVYENSIGVSWADSAKAWGFMSGMANVVVHTYNDMISIEDAEADIMSSTTLTAAEKEYAMEKVNQIKWGYAAVNLLRMASAVADYGLTAAYGPVVGTLVSTVLNTAANLVDQYLDNSLAYYVAGGQGSYMKWLIDPSGYVYEGVTTNRVKDVKVTLYHIPFDATDDTYWDSPKSENAVIWDAVEYSQTNPLFTDSEGTYAWDVPEGWWQVKYEKEGYETTYSEWLPVPPPQTEVNIGLTSTSTAIVKNIKVNDGSVVITFSQYIDPETFAGVVLKDANGNAIEYTVEYSKDETDIEGNVFAKVFTLNFATGTNVGSIKIPNTVTNYAGKAITAYSKDFTEASVVCGDVNDDGQVDNLDRLALTRYLADWDGYGEDTINMDAADVNQDGSVDNLDRLVLTRHLADWEGYEALPYAG